MLNQTQTHTHTHTHTQTDLKGLHYFWREAQWRQQMPPSHTEVTLPIGRVESGLGQRTADELFGRVSLALTHLPKERSFTWPRH